MSQSSTVVSRIAHSRRPRWALALVAVALCGAGAFAACGADDLPPDPVCGDGFCEQGEQGVCSDCGPVNSGPFCGDGRCEGGRGETFVSCTQDCVSQANVCGNGVCESGETCAEDCPEPTADCGNGLCEDGETPELCETDCQPPDLGDSCGDIVLCLNRMPEGSTAEAIERECLSDPAPGAMSAFTSYADCFQNYCPDPNADERERQDCNQTWCEQLRRACFDEPAAPVVCGDGICDYMNNEAESGSFAQCIADCGCFSNEECSSSEVCVPTPGEILSGACLPAYGQRYEVLWVDAEVADSNEGTSWDFPSSLADPYLVLSIDGRMQCQSNYTPDTTRPVWSFSPPCVLTIGASTILRMDVYDDDSVDDDFMFACEGIPVELLHRGGLSCESARGLGNFTLQLVPVP